MLYRKHPTVQLYTQAMTLTRHMPPDRDCQIALRFQKNCDRHRYQNPDATVREIAIILPGDGDQPSGAQDIILHRKNNSLQRITDCHPLYPSLRYVLLFPTGQLVWYKTFPFNELEDNTLQAADAAQAEDGGDNESLAEEPNVAGAAGPGKRKYISLAEYNRYRLHICPQNIDSQHIFLAGKLFQEYVCESWAIAEQKHLFQLKSLQTKLRVDIYQGLADAVAANADSNVDELGKRFILPSTFPGSTRNMQQRCQDALAINRYYGGGDLFITMTANTKWPEIQDALLHGQAASDYPDLVVRVFHKKLCALIKDVKDGALGDMAAYLYTIEYQKHGLPHAYIIIFLKPNAKLQTPAQIDSLMSLEFPLYNDELLELIKTFMVHTPCGDCNSSAPCMANGSCSKGFSQGL